MEKEPVSYRIAGIQILSKNMIAQLEPLSEKTLLNFDVKVESKIDEAKKYVFAIVNVKIRRGEETDALAAIDTVCAFEIPDFEKHIVRNLDGNFVIPVNLESAIRPIAISTTRGILYSELRGTLLHGAILPIIQLPPLPNPNK